MCSDAFRRDTGAEKPAALYRLGIGVAFIHPVTILHILLSALSTCLVWADLFPTGQAYFAVEKHSACAVVLRTLGLAPHLVLVSFLKRPRLNALVPVCE